MTNIQYMTETILADGKDSYQRKESHSPMMPGINGVTATPPDETLKLSS